MLKQENGWGTCGEMDRRFALAIAVAMLTVIFMLQLIDANMTFIIVLIAMIFFGRRSCSRLSLGEVKKSASEIEEALIIMLCSSGGIDFQHEVSSFLSSSSSSSFSFALSESARIDDNISLISEKAFV